ATNSQTNVGDNFTVSNFQCFDLTTMGLDSVSTVDEAITELQKRGINPYEYNAYNEGSIVDNKATKLYSRNSKMSGNVPLRKIGRVDLGTLNWSKGGFNNFFTNNVVGTNAVRPSTNYVIGNIYCENFKAQTSDDINSNHIQGIAISTSGYITIYDNAYVNMTTSEFKTAMDGVYLYYELIEPNAQPLQEVLTEFVLQDYDLTLPKMRSAGSVKDDLSKVRVGTKTNQSGSVGDTISFSDMKSNTTNIICDKGVVSEIGTLSGTTLTLTQAISNATFYYELATPTDQTASTYPSVVACEKGGSLEVEYDNTDNTPSDFTFNYSVYKPIE
ncbi:MAG: hypothetical protein J6T74_06085, partial [Clostridia bacterium]|nr:hypothetical protein [Clostridia bacterium]